LLWTEVEGHELDSCDVYFVSFFIIVLDKLFVWNLVVVSLNHG